MKIQLMKILRITKQLFRFRYLWKYREMKYTRIHQQYQDCEKSTPEKSTKTVVIIFTY